MAQPGRQPAATKTSANQQAIWVVVVVVVAICGLPIAIGVFSSRGDNNSTVVPAPTLTERTDTVALLKQASDAQGICYGWRLRDGTRLVSVGSNLGDGVPVMDNRDCSRWVEVSASVYYTSSSSEMSDWANVAVQSSPEIDAFLIPARLDRLALDDDAFIDDPGWAVCRAAASLPLLVAEIGAASPAPTTSAAPPAPGVSMPELPDAGNDIWRDRWGYLLAVAALLLTTVLLITVGLVQRGRQRR